MTKQCPLQNRLINNAYCVPLQLSCNYDISFDNYLTQITSDSIKVSVAIRLVFSE